MIAINPVLVLRIVQGVLAFIAMAVGATVANDMNTTHVHVPQTTVPSSVIFFIFTSVFTLLVTVPYTIVTPRYFPGPLAHPHAMLAAESTTAVFWLAGFAAVADLLRRTGSELCAVGACPATRGAVVVGVFEFLLFGITAFFAFAHVFLGGRFSGDNVDDEENNNCPHIKHSGAHRSWTGAERI